jgi:hypothetical protein
VSFGIGEGTAIWPKAEAHNSAIDSRSFLMKGFPLLESDGLRAEESDRLRAGESDWLDRADWGGSGRALRRTENGKRDLRVQNNRKNNGFNHRITAQLSVNAAGVMVDPVLLQTLKETVFAVGKA